MLRQAILCLALALVLLTGCTGRDTGSESPAGEASPSSIAEEISPSSSAETLTSSGPDAVDAPALELTEPGKITVYTKNRDSEIFTPHAVDVPAGTSPLTLADLVSAVEAELNVEIPVRSITQQKSMVVIDLESRLIDDNTKGEVEWILTSLAATLQQNHSTFGWLQYQLDGEVGVFGEEYAIPPVKLLEGDPAEFTAIRAEIPYEGLSYYPIENHILETDEVGRQLADYLALIDLYDSAVTSPAQLENKHILQTAIYATRYYTAYPDSEAYKPELKPFVAPASELVGMPEDMFWLKEHVEESIRLLYGDVPFTHEDFNKFRYLETLGVYTPPHMGGGARTLPAIFSYEDRGDTIRAEVAYVVESMGGYMTPATWDNIPEDELKSYVQTKAPRYVVIVKKIGDDWFLLESQQPMPVI